MKKIRLPFKKKVSKKSKCIACPFSSAEGGLCAEVVRKISAKKNEPKWMLDIRLQALEEFKSKPLPKWGPDLSFLNVDRIMFYLKPFKKQESSWELVPEYIKKTFEKLGVPQSEREHLAGLGAQYESEVVYHNLKKEWADKGVIFCDTDTALKKYPEIFKEYFCSIVPFTDNKFAALNTALWSGGSFIYIPKNVKIDIPLQAYLRINADRLGQFERTLIIADEGSFINYIEGCTASAYSKSCLHAAVVEVIAKKGSRIRYSTLQNWSRNVSNLVTKRAVAYENATVEWVDGNLGSGVTMKYPAVILKGENSKAEILSIAIATHEKQIQDAGAKVIHQASNTNSRIISKSISGNGGRSSYRGLVKIDENAKNCKSFVQCDALMLDDKSQSDTYPFIDVRNNEVNVGHEASVSQIDEEKLFYLMSRGLSAQEAKTFVVNGFIEPFVKTLPMEYAIEMNRLIEMEMTP
ncbi:MAG: Fe-S cluster assembly protein SufB [bacterium]